ncbi:MAG: ankyrin repeat domain-containing protein [Gemmatimonadaceae bacterium]
MLRIAEDDPVAVELCGLIRQGAVESLRDRLDARPDLATASIVDARGVARSLLHVVADWPGHLARGAEMVALLAAAGADVNAAVSHSTEIASAETPLHWAASSDDVAVLEALLDAGADLEAPGAIFTGGTAMSDAVVFAQWRAARALLARGARTTLWQAAALGLVDRVRSLCEGGDAPPSRDLSNALWHACRGGAQEVAAYLVSRGADLNWLGHDHKTPLDAALGAAPDGGNAALVDWLRAHGARRAAEL